MRWIILGSFKKSFPLSCHFENSRKPQFKTESAVNYNSEIESGVSNYSILSSVHIKSKKIKFQQFWHEYVSGEKPFYLD